MASKQLWDVVVVGGANIDYLIRGSKLPEPGETIDGEEFLIACGGKGANQAVAARRLGARAAFVGRLGADQQARDVAKNFRRERVDISRVQLDRGRSTGAALIMVDACAEKKILVAPGANRYVSVADINRAKALVQKTRVLLVQFEIPMRAVLAAAQLAHAAGARVVVDPAPAAKPPAALMKLVDFIRPNSSEAEALTGIKVRNRATARKAAQALLSRGIQAVAVQAGNEGDLLVWRDGEGLFPRLKVRSVDATGAGDAFAAAISVALAEGRTYREAGAFANAAAALTTTKFGAQTALPNRRDVLRLMCKSGYEREAGVF